MTRLYVSAVGDDENDGSQEYPFKTLEGVKRALKCTSGKIEVNFLDKWMCLDTPLILTNRHTSNSTITFAGRPDGYTTLCGATDVTGFEYAFDTNGKKVYKARVDKAFRSRHLYVDGCPRQRPRTKAAETKGWDVAENQVFSFYNLVEQFQSYMGTMDVYEAYQSADREMLNYKNKQDIEFVYDVGWSHSVCPVDNISLIDGKVIVRMRQPTFRDLQIKGGVQIGTPSYIENVFHMLMNAGEWYHDREECLLYYIPYEHEDMDAVKVSVPVLESLLEIRGELDKPAANIRFERIEFAQTTWLKPGITGIAEVQANLYKDPSNDTNFHSYFVKPPAAVTVNAAYDIRFKNCKFNRLGCTGMNIENGASGVVVEDCEFSDIAGSAIVIGGFNLEDAHPQDKRITPKNNTITNNSIHHIGIEYSGSVGILAGYTDGTSITHNDLSHLPYSAISVGWGWGFWDEYSDLRCHEKPLEHYPKFHESTVSKNIKVSYNKITKFLQKLHDGGGIYTLSMNSGSEIIGNLIAGSNRDVEPYDGIFRKIPMKDEEFAKPYKTAKGFPGGIYMDEGSGGFTVRENIVYDAVVPIFYHDFIMNGIYDTNRIEDNYLSVKPGDKSFPAEKAKCAGRIKYKK